MGLYVETSIRTEMDTLWQRTQDPAQHQRWDLRFSEIDYLPRPPGEPQRFRYAVRILPFLTVSGTGISAGDSGGADGRRVSVLRFASAHPLSLLAEGSGYWRYVPTPDGIRFLTGYDYRPRWGRFGAVADRRVFRPLMGWATAWSFDRLRLWCEHGVSPARSLAHGVAEVAVRLLATACVLALTALLALPAVAALPPAVLLFLVPPLPRTPAARRCLRKPPERQATSVRTQAAPALLATLERP
ncbi:MULTISPECIES: hypothetical protein [Streptomyces]|uniref:hypothetical protein n=1 Tax=Streptomyces TaxID=1883 RepID=UPI00084C7EA2|nr:MULTISPECIES: hypothetical protein [Streptomyces]TFI27314.1 hypothetical protein E4P36_14495 [Streptomyces sp. 4R-3d]